jgi:hypothetical protein
MVHLRPRPAIESPLKSAKPEGTIASTYEKVRDYLLSAANPRTRGKAAFFQGLGFDPAAWELLRDALLLIAQAEDVSPGQASELGTKYEIRATIAGPTGRRAVIRTVWIVNVGEDRPRFITAFPD